MRWRIGAGAGAWMLVSCAAVRPAYVDDRLTHASALLDAAPPLAQVANTPIGLQDIPGPIQMRLDDLDNQYAQRRFQLTWTGVEEVVANRLLEHEARRRQVSLDTLIDAEVDVQVGAPHEAELRDLYEANRALIQVPFDQAVSTLRQQWQQDRRRQLRRALVDRLRQASDVRFNMAPPMLPRYDVEVGDADFLGPQDAAVTIVEFGDYHCPYSAQARRLLQRLTELYPAQVRVAFRNFVLAGDPHAEMAAWAAQCAREQQRFWPYYDLLFENNQALDVADLKRYATQAELNLDAFESCLASDRPKQAVALEAHDGRTSGVQGTPALFVNGMRIEGVLPLPLMQAIIDQELRRR